MLADLLILAVAAFFLGMGLYALAKPGDVMARFGVTVDSVDGRNEVRAVYGGFGVAVAGMLVYAALTPGRAALWIPSVISLALLGMAAGRLISVVLDRARGGSQVWLYFVVEIVLAAMLFAGHALSSY